MMGVRFLAEWAVRSAILIVGAALLLWLFRVKNPAARLMAWTAALFVSLSIPLLTAALPELPILVGHPAAAPPIVAPRSAAAGNAGNEDDAVPGQPEPQPLPAWNAPAAAPRFAKPVDWPRLAFLAYASVTAILLLRLLAGLALSLRLLAQSRPTGIEVAGAAVRESDRVNAPVTLGILRPAMVLPPDWRNWEARKRNAVLAHELSHIARRDPAVQFLSAIHRALLWASPFAWFLHRAIVRTAEEVSDDAAIAETCDRASYAEILLEFIGRGVRRTGWQGVPMARYDRPEKRIQRILESTALARGVTRWGIAAILAAGAPLAYLAAAGRPETPLPAITAPAPVVAAVPTAPAPAAPQATPAPAPQPKPAPPPQAAVEAVAPSVDQVPWNVLLPEEIRVSGSSACGEISTFTVGLPSPARMTFLTGAPYSGRQVESSVRTLADGSHLRQDPAGRQFTNWRDSAGRVRTEHYDPPGEKSRFCEDPFIQLQDPVAGYYYLLDPANRVVHRVPLDARPYVRRLGPPRQGTFAAATTYQVLGYKTIGGAKTIGMKETRVTPPGSQMGNDAPYTQAEERWISPELGLALVTKRSDDTGEVRTSTIEDLRIGEPDPNLMQVPPDYRIVDEVPAADRPRQVRFTVTIGPHN